MARANYLLLIEAFLQEPLKGKTRRIGKAGAFEVCRQDTGVSIYSYKMLLVRRDPDTGKITAYNDLAKRVKYGMNCDTTSKTTNQHVSAIMGTFNYMNVEFELEAGV